MTSRMSELASDAHALTAFRALPDGRGRQYSATYFPSNPRGGIDQFLRQVKFWLTDSFDCYAVLDVLNEDGDIVQDFNIADARGFQQIKRRLHLEVESTDGGS